MSRIGDIYSANNAKHPVKWTASEVLEGKPSSSAVRQISLQSGLNLSERCMEFWSGLLGNIELWKAAFWMVVQFRSHGADTR
jgi:hypothetical protein